MKGTAAEFFGEVAEGQAVLELLIGYMLFDVAADGADELGARVSVDSFRAAAQAGAIA